MLHAGASSSVQKRLDHFPQFPPLASLGNIELGDRERPIHFMRAVFDNNILVRANPKNAGPARRLLRLFQAGPNVLVLSREILQELERVLLYPRLQKRFQMTAADIAAFLTELAESSVLVVPASVPTGLVRDAKDEPVLGNAVAGRADVLCTRDLDLCDDRVRAFAAERGIRIVGDLELLALLDGQAARQDLDGLD